MEKVGGEGRGGEGEGGNRQGGRGGIFWNKLFQIESKASLKPAVFVGCDEA